MLPRAHRGAGRETFHNSPTEFFTVRIAEFFSKRGNRHPPTSNPAEVLTLWLPRIFAILFLGAKLVKTKTEVSTVWEVEKIGQTAGLVWNFLRSHGECSLTGVEKGVEAPKAMVSMAIGWLAREGKIDVKDEKKAVRISLREL